MRIAVVHSAYSSESPSGENVAVAEQVQVLQDAGHEVELFTRATDDARHEPAYVARSAVRVALGVGNNPGAQIGAFRPDVVHVHNLFPNFGVNWLRQFSNISVATLHNYRSRCAAGTFFRDGVECHSCLDQPVVPALRHRCYKGSVLQTLPVAVGSSAFGATGRYPAMVAHRVVLNEDMRRLLEPLASSPCSVVPNFVSPAPPEVGHRRGWAVVSRLSPEKGVGDLLRVWDRSRELHVFGDGELGDELRHQYRGEPWLTLHGNVPRDALLERLGGFEGVVVPSMCAEGLPTVILEAMARGVPQVLSSLISTAPALARAGCATTVDMSTLTERSLRDTLAAVAERRAEMAKRSRKTYEETYSPSVWLRQMGAVYARVVSDSGNL